MELEKAHYLVFESTRPEMFQERLNEAEKKGYQHVTIEVKQGLEKDFAEPLYCAVMELKPKSDLKEWKELMKNE